jgi:hypothetical protein
MYGYTEYVSTVTWLDGTCVMRMTYTFDRVVTLDYVLNHPGLRSFYACKLFGLPVLSPDGLTATFTRL